ncbi:pseudouridine synthase [uncultured Bacteroides sp.]|uniref:RluA family pseudouridine synthase n=1 Tax=uncultured Bacteroides sp. TaxID=162156 RepID=UPI0035A5EF22
MLYTDYIHRFSHKITGIPLPVAFTFPFHYTPHKLTILAADEVQAYLRSRTDWEEELHAGKMFGVLVVRTSNGQIGYLAAFSGNLAGSNLHDFFVPPIYDLLQPDGFFRIEEANISAINMQIKKMEESMEYQSARTTLAETTSMAEQQLSKAKHALKEAKAEREKKRVQGVDETELKRMERESQFQKAEYKRMERRMKDEINVYTEKLQTIEKTIDQLKQERRKRSARLQQQLFEQFHILNAKGEIKDLCEIFKDTPQKTPPAGAGECALPKLLQFAYLHRLEPLAMGEFWWGMSPKDEIRHEGHFYPSCKSKCEPILKHMLIGLKVEKNPLAENIHKDTPLEIIYEDEWIVVINKPAGMLSVPGKDNLDSVSQRLHRLYPHATGPLIVHRLDMATSGLMLAAKDKNIHQQLQALFETRKIKKRYTAILEGNVPDNEGKITLPLCPDINDRPRQRVDYEYGKPAVTLYKVLEKTPDETLVSFYPQTGRTHQLRVHAAHNQGLNCPIKGDELYGKKSDRLYLHATELSFIHPVTGKKMHIIKESGFSIT